MVRSTQSNRALAMVLKRRRWRAGDAAAVLSAWRASGETMSAFTRRHGLDAWRLKYWRRQLAESETIRLHPVQVIPGPSREASPDRTSGLELVLRGGRRIAVQRGFDAELLEDVVRAVESWPC